MEVVDAVISVWGAERVGVRLSPHARGDGIVDSDPASTFGHAAAALSERRIAYLHLIEAVAPGLPQSPPPGSVPIMKIVRKAFTGPLIVNGGYTRETAEQVISSCAADMVAFAALFIANPDLVKRLRYHAPLNKPDHPAFTVVALKAISITRHSKRPMPPAIRPAAMCVNTMDPDERVRMPRFLGNGLM